MMLALLLFAVLGEWLQPGIISQAPGAMVVRAERSYKDAPANTIGQLLLALFRIGCLAMGICLCLEPEGRFSFVSFAVVCGLIFGMLMVKMLCNVLLNYTFEISRLFAGPYELYANIATLTCLVLYPALLLTMHFGTVTSHRHVLAGATVLFLALWAYRSFRLFVISPKAMGYWALYIGTLEILPLGALYFLSEKTLSLL